MGGNSTTRYTFQFSLICWSKLGAFLITVTLVLYSAIHLWNSTGFPIVDQDEGHYMRKAIQVLHGSGPQETALSCVWTVILGCCTWYDRVPGYTSVLAETKSTSGDHDMIFRASANHGKEIE